MAETPRRSFRVSNERHEKAQEAARVLGTDLTTVVNDAFEALVKKAAKKAKEPVGAGE